MKTGERVPRGILATAAIALLALAAGYGIGSRTAGTIEVRTSVVTERLVEVATTVVPELRTVTATVPVTRIAIIDALGREVVFDRPPGRVVSLAPSITEILFSLGLGDRVVGVTSHCDYPPEVPTLVKAGKIAVIGGFWSPDLEKILALEPDLVVGSAGTPPHLRLKDSLEKAGIRVVYIRGTASVNKYDVYSDIRAVAKIFGVERLAEELIDKIERETRHVEGGIPKDKRPKVFFLLGPPAWGLYSVGGNTFIDWVIRTAGGANIAGRFSGWPLLDYEFILSQDPDVIIVSAMGANHTALAKEIGATPLAQTTAFKSGRVYLVDMEANDILVRPGPRLGSAVRLIAAILHPEVFGEVKIPVVYRVEEGSVSPSGYGLEVQPTVLAHSQTQVAVT